MGSLLIENCEKLDWGEERGDSRSAKEDDRVGDSMGDWLITQEVRSQKLYRDRNREKLIRSCPPRRKKEK